jgi:hypothetical protein
MCMHPHRKAAALPQKIVTVLVAMFVDAKN